MSTCNVSGNSSKYFLRGYSVIQGCTKGLLLQGQLQVCERVTFSKELFVSNVVFYIGIRVWTSGQSLPYKTYPRGLNMTLHVLSELAIQLEQSVIPYTDALSALTLKNFCIKEATVDNFCKCKHKLLFSPLSGLTTWLYRIHTCPTHPWSNSCECCRPHAEVDR